MLCLVFVNYIKKCVFPEIMSCCSHKYYHLYYAKQDNSGTVADSGFANMWQDMVKYQISRGKVQGQNPQCWFWGSSPPEAESLLSIFIQKMGQQLRN